MNTACMIVVMLSRDELCLSFSQNEPVHKYGCHQKTNNIFKRNGRLSDQWRQHKRSKNDECQIGNEVSTYQFFHSILHAQSRCLRPGDRRVLAILDWGPYKNNKRGEPRVRIR